MSTRTTDSKVHKFGCSTNKTPQGACDCPGVDDDRTADLEAKLAEMCDREDCYGGGWSHSKMLDFARTAARLALLEGARLAYDGIPEPWTDKFGNYHTDGLHAWPAFADYLSALARDLGGE